MTRVTVQTLAVVLGVGAGTTAVVAAAPGQAGGGQYQVVKVCSLLTVAEVKKLAPWEPMFDEDALGKGAKLEAVAGVGDAAWLRNNRDQYAELMAKVGPHLLTVQLHIDRDQTFDSSKPAVLGLGKAFAAKLR